jgi:iron complex outermembrane receptor protein
MSALKLSALCSALLSAGVYAVEKPIQKDEQSIETLVITANPIGRSVLESATPVTILGGEALDNSQAATLGETLKGLPGVNSTYFGPVASSPIIRGLDGPRVKVLQNGLDTSDASRVGPDHVTTVEASTATQIEVLRGPATLLYGSGAIGGVVNVVDNRLLRERQENINGEVATSYDSVSNEKMLSGDINAGIGNFAFHADGFSRDSDDYDIPDEASDPDSDSVGTLENSAIDASGGTVGIGWIGDDVNVAFSYAHLDNEYGVPGHEHDHEEEEEEHDDEDHDEEEHDEEESVFARLKQDRYQSRVDWQNIDGPFTQVQWLNAYTDYEHSEIEDGAVGTTFSNEAKESRLWAKHTPLSGWEGVVGVHYTSSDFSALGEEAFTPSTKTTSTALFVLEEKQAGAFLWQLGARFEYSKHQPDNNFFSEEEHDDEDADEEHEEIHFADQSFNASSFSAGVVYTLNKKSSLAFNYARSERAPSAAEIFSNGLHISTGTYEVGAGFEIELDDDGYELVQSTKSVDKEISNNVDLTYRYQDDTISADVSIFYNDIANYLYEQDTGLDSEQLHGHEDEEEEDEHDHEEDATPVFIFRQQDAVLYGFEAQLDWHLNENLRIESFADYTRAKLDEAASEDGNRNVPRIPAMRLGMELHWETDNWHAELGATRYATQDKFASYETQTDGYTLVSVAMNYYTTVADSDVTLFVKGNNLTDRVARVHSSFLKDVAPLPGRSFVLGARVNF